MMSKRWMIVLVLALAGWLQAGIIYYDDFGGSNTTNLHGQAPALGGSAWVAHTSWKANGSVTASQSCATLPFVPQAGKVYLLSARMTNLTSAYNTWMAMGFAAGSATTADGNSRFVSGATMGQPWMIHRSNNDTRADQSFAGAGTANGLDITGSYTGDVDLQIILNTTAAQWKATWLIKKTSSSSFTQARTFTYVTNPTIRTVGFACTNAVGKAAWFMLEEISDGNATKLAPVYGAMDMPTTTKLAWTAGTAAGITGHKLYITADEPNFINVTPLVITGSGDQSDITPPITLLTDKTYFWRVDEMADPNVIAGSVWFFDTVKSVPIIDVNPAGAAAFPAESALFETKFTSLTAPSATWYKEAGVTDIKLGVVSMAAKTVVSGDYTLTLATGATAGTYVTDLTITNVALEDESYYYCVVSNASGKTAETQAAGLTVNRILAYYPFDGSANDAIGTNHGTLKSDGLDPNLVPGFGAGIVGAGAIQLDGTQCVQLAPTAYPNAGLGGGIRRGTISCWVRFDGVVEAQTNVFLLGTHNNADSTAYQFWIDPTPEDANFRIRHTGGDASYAVGTTNPPVKGDGQWHLFTATYAEGGTVQTYLDGAALGAAASFSSGLAFTAWEFPILIGANNNRGVHTGWLIGALDDMKIYNYPLSKTEVADLYLAVHPEKKFCILNYASTYDFNKDCIVDMSDFATLANVWLSCGVYPDCK